MVDILIRSPEVQARTGLAKSTLHNLARRGGFPRPVKLGARAVAWRESDVDAWIAGLQQAGVGNNNVIADLEAVGSGTPNEKPLRGACVAQSFQPKTEK